MALSSWSVARSMCKPPARLEEAGTVNATPLPAVEDHDSNCHRAPRGCVDQCDTLPDGWVCPEQLGVDDAFHVVGDQRQQHAAA
jgi:hypothetical protein